MTTVKFKGLECEASIDAGNIVLFCIEEGKAQEFVLVGAAYDLEKEVDAEADRQRKSHSEWASFRDDKYARDQVREELIDRVIDSFTGEVLETTEHLN
jgi:hypothetical protein